MKIILVTWLSSLVSVAKGIICYECNSSTNFTCTEYWDPGADVVNQYKSNCAHVFEASYCVKMTGVFEGKLGTKRFCSSRNWGNYCEYIKRPGDVQEYRSCVFSCTTSSCNSGRMLSSMWISYSLLPIITWMLSSTWISHSLGFS